MRTRSIAAVAISALAYLLVVFPLAYLWHLLWFKGAYERIGYIGRAEPLFAFGVASMLMQGVLLAAGYRLTCAGRYGLRSALLFCLAAGAFFWTTHALASAAKNAIADLLAFVMLETAFVILQFGCFAFLLGAIHRRLL